MRTIPFSTIIGQSFNRTKAILFQPFSFKKWLKLLFIAWLAGALGGGGNFNVSRLGNQSEGPSDAQAAFDFLPDIITTEAQAYGKSTLMNTDPIQSEPKTDPLKQNKSFREGWEEARPYLGGIVMIGLIFLLPLMILFTWLCARFKFVWYNSITENSDLIGSPFKRYTKEGNSQFFFLMIIMFIGLLLFAGIGFWAFSSVKPFLGDLADGNFESIIFPALKAGLGPIIILILFGIASTVVYVLNEHLVIPIQAMDASTFKEGWRRFLDIYKENTKDIWLFLLVLIGLGFCSGIIAMVVMLLFLLAILFVGAIVFGIPYLIFILLLKAEALFGIFAFIAGIPFVIAVILLMAMIQLPFAVFFRCFSLYYLTSLDCGYIPLIFSEPEAAGDKTAL
ncbi:MAG: hypothetical protein KAR05_04185 [Candidatus Omnitrophica bacterium]|nr:hypothetical protein [Candidatus Omnitrophota bacterium]